MPLGGRGGRARRDPRHSALVNNRRVLYAASGPNQADIMRRIISAQTGGDYPRLKQGRLTAHEQQVARELVQAPLLIDDGSELTPRRSRRPPRTSRTWPWWSWTSSRPPTTPGFPCLVWSNGDGIFP
ncbi:hypothetical protein ACWFR5_15640 [Streptomyces sp. NPDC055092]